MLNFLYVEYPYGTSEAFVEYEMRALGTQNTKFNIYVLSGDEKSKKRFVPENAKVHFMENKSFKTSFFTLLKMFNKSSLREVLYVFKNRPKDGILRCLNRIYRYQKVAVGFEKQYRKLKSDDSQNTFVSYWLNECAFALVELKKKYPNIKVASRGHGFDVFKERGYMPFRYEILSGLDKIYLINKASNEYFKKNYEWLDISKIEISHLGVDIPKVAAPKAKEEVFRIVTCSTVIPLKRLDLMIDALSGLKDKKIEWVHFGGGPLLEKIKEYADEKLSGGSLNYIFKGQVPLKEVHKYYSENNVHLFVNCSDTEGTPVSVMEAMSYGIPAIARNVGGVSEVIDNECGALLPQEESAEVLRNAIDGFYKLDSHEYEIFCQNARRKIENEFNASEVFEEYIKSVCSL